MTTDTILDIAAVFSTFFMIGVIVWWNHKQYTQMEEQLKIQNEKLKTQNKQIKYDFFAIYTGRYQKIALHLPVDIYEYQFRFEKLTKNKREEALRYMRVYFDLCYEQFFLNNKGLIDGEVWKDWKKGMKFTFAAKAFREIWQKEFAKSDFYDKFKDFVHSELIV